MSWLKRLKLKKNKKENIGPTNKVGQYHGLCIGYWSNGKIRYKKRYDNGKLHGLCIWYHNNGKVLSKERWVNGNLHGITEGYLIDDKLLFKVCYINGEFVYGEYYGNTNRIQFYI